VEEKEAEEMEVVKVDVMAAETVGETVGGGEEAMEVGVREEVKAGGGAARAGGGGGGEGGGGGGGRGGGGAAKAEEMEAEMEVAAKVTAAAAAKVVRFARQPSPY
jgi:hypothetical protein